MCLTTESNLPCKSKSDAKETLKRLLILHKGDAKHPEVNEALNNLIQLAANERASGDSDDDTWSPAHDMNINKGHWRSITTPPFRGKLDDETDGKTRFTLGRMSFGMFKPTTAVCAVDDIVNIVEDVVADNSENEKGEETPNNKKDEDVLWTQTYTIDVLMEIETQQSESGEKQKLPARLTNYGVCFPTTPTRLGVKFTQGTLKPNFDLSDSTNATLTALWKKIFHNAIAKEAEAKSYLGQLGTWAMHLMMRAMMGLEPPKDSVDYTQTYKIGRPYVGHLDIVYLDDNFRVTRGNKGTIVVVERLTEKEEKE